jgi:hypothetical protein
MFFNIIISIILILMLCIKGVRKILRLMIWMPIWYTVYFFLCHPKTTLVMLAFAVGVITTTDGGIIDTLVRITTPSSSVTPQPQHDSNANQGAKGVALKAQRVTKLPAIIGELHDGNSRFAEDILPRLSEPELIAYSREFYDAILNGKDNTPLIWKLSDRTFGKIVPYKRFVSNGGAQCRHYMEILSINGYAQELKQVACEQADKKAWCRLSPEAIPSCEMGYSNEWEIGVNKMKNYFSNW